MDVIDDEHINKDAHLPTTDDDLKDDLHGKVNIIEYHKLKQVKNIDDILKNDCCIFLIENTMRKNPPVGHWTCIMKRKERDGSYTLSYFDSYGRKPDYKGYAQKNNGQITRLMVNSPYNLEYNPLNVQSKGYATCGRHCVVRLIYKDRPLKEYMQFMKFFKNRKNGIGDDELVTYITENISH